MRPFVVVTGSVSALGVIRSLGMAGVPVVFLSCDRRDVARTSRFVLETIHVPDPEHDEAAFLGVLDQVAAQYPGALLAPASDPAVAVIPRHGQWLRRLGFVQGWADADAAATFLDKAATSAVAERAAVPAPVTIVPTDRSDIEEFARIASFPAVLKPLISHTYHAHFKTKWVRVNDTRQALAEYDRAVSAGFDVLIQEFIPGDDLAGANYNAYFWKGEPRVEVTAGKIRNFPVHTGSPCATVSQHIPEVVELGRRLLAAVEYSGFANAEFKRDARDGRYKLIEVNARYNQSSMLATHCGINFPLLQYRHLMHDQLPEPRDSPEGVHWVDVTRDVRAGSHYLRQPDYTWRQMFRPYVQPHVCAVWSWRDPCPALLRGLWSVRRLVTGVARARAAARDVQIRR